MTTKIRKRRGGITVFFAFCLIGLMGFTAVAVDGGVLLDMRQRIQAATDVAALAAANDLFANYNTNHGTDPKNSARDAALAVAKAQGFTNVAVNIPPKSGPFATKAGYVEIIITYDQRRYFSKVFGTSNVTMTARAVAQGRWEAFKGGILVLNPTLRGSLTTTGNAVMTVAGVPIIVDSNDMYASWATGSGTMNAPEFDITGIPGTGGSGIWNGTIRNGQTPQPDPLAWIPEPDPSTMVVQSKNATHFSGNGNKTEKIQPGVYVGGITVSGQVNLDMAPGIYYMQGGGFSFTGQGAMNATGVMIVNAPQSNSDVINLSGTGSVNFTPPTSGLYQGITLWQQRSSTNVVSVTGNGGQIMKGTFYTQHGILNVTGNGANNVIGGQYISDQLIVNGGGIFAVSWDKDTVARTRNIGLVE